MARYSVTLTGGAPWGFRLRGDEISGTVTISKINPRSKAAESRSISVGDTLESINNRPVRDLDLRGIQELIYNTKDSLHLVLATRTSSISNGGTTMSSAEVIDTNLPTSVHSNLYSPSSPKSPIWQNGKPADLSVIAPPPVDILNNNNNKPQNDPWNEWLPPPPPDWQMGPPPPLENERLTNGMDSPTGVWQPGQAPEQNEEYNEQDNFHDLQPVWTPSSSQSAKKEFRSVRPPQQNQVPDPPQIVHPAQQAPPSPVRRQQPPPSQRQHQPQMHTAVHHPAAPQPTPSSPSRVPDPAQLPSGALYQKITIDGDKIHTDTYYPMEDKPKHETTNLNEDTSQKVVQKAPTYEGIGPRDQESGMPLGLRQHVKEDNRHDWYKEMYKSIHKQERDEDGNPMVASYEMKEPPTPQPATDTANPFENLPSQSSKSAEENPVVSTPINRYRQQPRSIVDYEPGKSSLAGTPAIKAQSVQQDHTAPPIERQRSGYGSDDENQRARRNLSASQSPDKSNPSLGASNISGKDKNYNYKNPPHTLDKVTVQKMIEEEKKKRAQADRERQERRRHSDFTSTKGPIITDDRFKDILADAKPLVDNTAPKEIHQQTRACAVALYSFNAQSPKELSFKKGDTLYLIKEVDKNWYKGEHHGRSGIFPKAYVEVVTSIDEARKNQLALPSKEGKARAKFKFKGETQNELSFSKHDYIDLMRRIDANWWEGRIGPRTGIFPDSYVEVLKHPEVVQPAASSTGSTRAPLSPSSRGSYSPTGGPISPVGSYGSPHSPSSRAGQSPMRRPANQQPARTQPVSPGKMADERLTQTQVTPVKSQPPYQQQYHQPVTQQYKHQNLQQPVTTPQSQQLRAPSSPGGTGQAYSVDRQSPTPITREPQDQYQAMYNYFPQNDDELELRDGDMVVVLEKCDDGWFVGSSMRTGMFGTFPGNYVVKV